MMHGANSPPRNGLMMSRNKREGHYYGYLYGHHRRYQKSEISGVWIDEEFNPSDADRAILEAHIGSLEVRYFVPSESV